MFFRQKKPATQGRAETFTALAKKKRHETSREMNSWRGDNFSSCDVVEQIITIQLASQGEFSRDDNEGVKKLANVASGLS